MPYRAEVRKYQRILCMTEVFGKHLHELMEDKFI